MAGSRCSRPRVPPCPLERELTGVLELGTREPSLVCQRLFPLQSQRCAAFGRVCSCSGLWGAWSRLGFNGLEQAITSHGAVPSGKMEQ